MMPCWLVTTVGGYGGRSGLDERCLAGVEKHQPECGHSHKVSGVSQSTKDKVFCDVLSLPFCHSVTCASHPHIPMASVPSSVE